MRLIITTLLVISINLSFAQGYYKDYLEYKIANNDGELIPVIVKLKNQVDISRLKQDLLQKNIKLEERQKEIVKKLYTENSKSSNLFNLISELQNENPSEIINVKRFWAVNVITFLASKSLLEIIVSNLDVDFIQYDFPVYGDKVTETKSTRNKSIEGAEVGLVAINARGLWNLGYTGRNRIAMNIDTGVNQEHPTLKDKFLGVYLPLSQTWLGYENPYPYDIDQSHSHGTHTMGTMIGLDVTTQDTIGLAFNSFWIASDPIVTSVDDVRPLSDYFIAFEWALNPDGNLNTSNDIPDVINNSWGVDNSYWTDVWGADCNPIEYDFIAALEAVDCSVIFSAGNEGPDAETIGMPAGIIEDSLNIFSVGALDAEHPDYNIASFSSRGPSECASTSPQNIKPEVSAPGVDVRSASGTDSYRLLSGTSMAAPHVSGAILLLREAFPNVTSDALKNALYQTAIDLGDAGEDNVYGRGLIDVFAAYEFLSESYTPTPPISNQYDIAIDTVMGAVKYTCSTSNNYSIKIKNKGTELLSNFVFRVVLNNDTLTEDILSISLNPNETYTVSYTLDYVDTINSVIFEIEKNTIDEFNIYNNYFSFNITKLFENELPYFNDFEQVSQNLQNSNFAVLNTDNQNTWQVLETGGLEASTKSLNMPFAYYTPREGQIDELIIGAFNIPELETTYLFFKHAYTQYFNTRKDSLFILVSDNCEGISSDTVFKSGGEELRTRDKVTGNFIPTTEDEWRDNAINLTAYAGQTIYLRFVAKNDASNNLFIDNLRIENGTDYSVGDELNNKLSVYPNPSKGVLFIQNITKGTHISIYNSRGELLINKMLMKESFDLSSLKNGLYFIKTDSGQISKFVILK